MKHVRRTIPTWSAIQLNCNESFTSWKSICSFPQKVSMSKPTIWSFPLSELPVPLSISIAWIFQVEDALPIIGCDFLFIQIKNIELPHHSSSFFWFFCSNQQSGKIEKRLFLCKNWFRNFPISIALKGVANAVFWWQIHASERQFFSKFSAFFHPS